MPRKKSFIVPDTPKELGILGLKDWRDHQPEAIENAVGSHTRFTVGCAPTGFGKSVCYVAQAVIEGGRTAIITENKGLQDPLQKFSNLGLVDIRGKGNYPCAGNPEWTCSEGYSAQCPMANTMACSSFNAYMQARSAKIVTTNYKYWILIHKYGNGLGPFDLVIFDEAGEAPEELADSLTVQISYHETEMIKFPFPDVVDDPKTWKEWAGKARVKATEAFNVKKSQIASARLPKPSWIRDFAHLKNLAQKASQIALMRPGDWVWENNDVGWVFDPIKFNRFAESRLFLKHPRFMFYSATVRPKTMHMMGVSNDKMTFFDYPSVFDPKRSPIYCVPSMRMDKSHPDISAMVMRMDQMAGPRLRLERNGLVYVTSFDYQKTVAGLTRYRSDVVPHKRGEPVGKALGELKRSDGKFLITPSVKTGHDLVDDHCRWIAVTKLPFPPATTEIRKARQKDDPTYTGYTLMQDLNQIVGRGTRSETDWCENFIFDDHFHPDCGGWFLKANKHFATRSFLERLQYRKVIPPPMEPEKL